MAKKKRPVPLEIQLAHDNFMEAKIMRLRREIDFPAFERAKRRYIEVLYKHGRNDLAEDIHAMNMSRYL